jgi:3-deoxy-D-manno-octulosonic-acid transferase
MRTLYSLAWLLALPFAFLHLLWRARRQPDYLRHWGERLGRAPVPPPGPVIWLHAVSVGETRAAAPLVQALRERYPRHVLLLTHTTPTGRAAGLELFGDRVTRCYLPYDLPLFVQRFLDRVRPALGIVMETEIWPNLTAACRERDIPLFLINARLSEKSARGYARFPGLARETLAGFRIIAAQSRDDAERLELLGARGVRVSGNLKFDVTTPADTGVRAAVLRAACAGRFVFLAASTREGEEALILDACAGLDLTDFLLMIVPRHPQRFQEVANLIAARGLELVRRSEGHGADPHTQVFLGDSMGELAAYYAACDVAFVGGSLLPFGGQNLIEAAAAGKPVLIGPHTWNFAQAAELAVAAGAARRVSDGADLASQVERLYRDEDLCRRMGQAGLDFARAHRGATGRVMAMLIPTLEGASV